MFIGEIAPNLDNLSFPTTDYELQKTLKFISRNGLQIVDKKTQNINAPSTVYQKLVSRNIIEEDRFDLRRYLQCEHFTNLSKEILSDHPKCEGQNCQNKATKIYIKNFSNVYHETREDVVAICDTCRLVKGVIYTNFDRREMVEEAMKDPAFKEIMKEAVKEYITKEAINVLKM